MQWQDLCITSNIYLYYTTNVQPKYFNNLWLYCVCDGAINSAFDYSLYFLLCIVVTRLMFIEMYTELGAKTMVWLFQTPNFQQVSHFNNTSPTCRKSNNSWVCCWCWMGTLDTTKAHKHSTVDQSCIHIENR